MKSILLIGLGRFGRHMAAKLYEMKNEVLAVDIDEDRVNEALPFVTRAQIGDSTNEQFVATLGVRNFDVCMVAIGDDFQSSLETTALLKDLGARFVVARANRDVHAKFLLRNGADQVVYAEKEMAIRSAVKYGSNNVFDYVELTPEYSIYEIPVPAAWVGKTIVQTAVRTKYHISILATKRNGQIDSLPKADHLFDAGETLI
ncbi:MAG: TrkA family potassium uptake protein, partial [Oscillospiraceae bacterium]